MSSYLSRVGKPVPPTANPAEFMLDCINADFSGMAGPRLVPLPPSIPLIQNDAAPQPSLTPPHLFQPATPSHLSIHTPDSIHSP
eukprot:scaffold2607_cov118-Isochrysis_galbana.AAC.1